MNQATRATSAILAAILAQLPARAQSTVLVSVDSTGTQGDADSYRASISPDARFVAFVSDATNLVPGDSFGVPDVFVLDRLSGTTECASRNSFGQMGNLPSENPALSADGRFVVFESDAWNMAGVDTNATRDIFLRDRQLGTTERISVGPAGVQANSRSIDAALSPDGRFVVFTSFASNLVAGDTNAVRDIFVRDLQSGTNERVSLSSSGAQANDFCDHPGISADGRFMTFESAATNLVPGDTNASVDIFVRDRLLGTTVRVSVNSAGGQANSESRSPAISADGSCVAFFSFASNLVPGDTNATYDVFVHELQTGATRRVNVATGGAQANTDASQPSYVFVPSISADGRFVTFHSLASNLVAGDTNGVVDVFLRDRLSGTTERVSVGSGGTQAQAISSLHALTPDGRFVAFTSYASNLVAGDTNGFVDVFVRDRGDPPPPAPFCFGDGNSGACPCGNSGAAGRGCENSASTGGALQTASGASSLASDTLVLASSGELPSALSIFLQGDAAIAPLAFGDGLRCTGGSLKRLYQHTALGGVVSAPQAGDPSVSARSAALGAPISVGATRYYQTYYRDPLPGFCASPPGNTWNVSSGLAITWAQ